MPSPGPCSVEAFVPRSAAGMPALVERLVLLANAAPRALSLSGPTSTTLQLAQKAKEAMGSSTAIQVQCETSTSKEALEGFLTKAVAAGVTEVLLLPASAGAAGSGFASVLEMVSFVVERFGSQLSVVVSGFLRGTKGENGHYSKDIAACAEQVKAGASRVVTTPVWDVNHLIQFQMDLRSAGARSVEIDPALLPLHALDDMADFLRLCSQLEWTPPKGLAADLDKLSAGAAAWTALGARYFSTLQSELLERCKGCVTHVITLNHVAALDAMRSVGYTIPAAPAAAAAAIPAAGVAPTGAAAAGAGAGAGGGAAAAVLSVPAGSTLYILHSAKLALEVAELAKAAIAKSCPGLTLSLVCMEGFKPWAAEKKLLEADPSLPPLYMIFIVETVEEGQPCEAAGPCTRLLNRRSHAAGCLARVRYCVLGLGDSNLLLDRQTTTAKDCNQVARSLNTRLGELGAVPFHAYGESDDRTGNQELQPWVDGLGKAIREA